MLIVMISVLIAFLLFAVLSALIIAKQEDDRYTSSWENCDGNCDNCRDKEQCMNRPY